MVHALARQGIQLAFALARHPNEDQESIRL